MGTTVVQAAFLGSSFAQSEEPESLLKVLAIFFVVHCQTSGGPSGSSFLAHRGGR